MYAWSLRLRVWANIRHGGDLDALLASPSHLKQHVHEVLQRGKFRGRKTVIRLRHVVRVLAKSKSLCRVLPLYLAQRHILALVQMSL